MDNLPIEAFGKLTIWFKTKTNSLSVSTLSFEDGFLRFNSNHILVETRHIKDNKMVKIYPLDLIEAYKLELPNI